MSTFCAIGDSLIWCPQTANKKNAIERDCEKVNNLYAECNDEKIRMILLKINLRESFETNFKRINSFKMIEKVKALIYLLGNDEEETKPADIKKYKSEGITLALLRRIYSLTDHKCDRCHQWVIKNRQQEVTMTECVACGTRACGACFDGTKEVPFCCPNCLIRIRDLNKVPTNFMVSRFSKQKENTEDAENDEDAWATQVEKEYDTTQEPIEEITQTQDRLPCAQRSYPSTQENNDTSNELETSFEDNVNDNEINNTSTTQEEIFQLSSHELKKKRTEMRKQKEK